MDQKINQIKVYFHLRKRKLIIIIMKIHKINTKMKIDKIIENKIKIQL